MKRKSGSQSRSTKGTRIHVIARKEGWAVKKEGTAKARKIYDTKDAAVKGASRGASKGQEVIIHKKDGSIERWNRPKR